MENIERLELQTKAFMADLLAGVNKDDSIQNNISYMIKEVGRFTHADMVCIYESREKSDSVNKIYQWKADSSVVEDAKMQPIQERKLDDWIELLKLKKMVLVESRECVPNTMPFEYERMEQRGIHTFLIVPLYAKDRLPACMSIINPDLETFSLLESMWLFLGQEIGQLFYQERIRHKRMLLMEGISSSNLSELIIDYKTKRYEAFRITRVLRNVIPEEGEWEWLRQFYASIIMPEYREELLRKTEKEYIESYLCSEQNSFSIDLAREVNGNKTWFRLEFSVVSLDEKGHLERFVLLVKDITQTKKEEEEHLQMITALSGFYKVIFMIDLKKQSAQNIKHAEVAWQHYQDGIMPYEIFLDTFISRMVEAEYVNAIREFMNPDTMENRMRDMNALSREYHGKNIEWGRIVLAPAKRNRDGGLERVVFAVQDITEQKKREEWMQYKMEHDELTGTLNRTAFNRVTKLLEDNLTPFALILLDIDNFKTINDTHGHDVGDEVLSQLITALNEKMRSVDKIFRIGGDEFAIIMNRITLEQANRVKSLINQVNEITMSDMNDVPPFSISAGVTFSICYNENVFHNADKALYRTKETTRKGCTVFEEMD